MKQWYLDEKLKAYSQTNAYPFHMPGHKRQPLEAFDPYKIDITEIDGFDDLHHSEGILKEAEERAAKLYGAKHTFYLINGSTVGLLSAIFGSISDNEELLIARNCHKSVYHGAMLRKASLFYLYPEQTADGINGSIEPEAVQSQLEEHPKIRTVIITSPTYEGVVSDIKKIAKIVHDHDGILIVDEAHGAHLGLADGFPKSAVQLGADVVIQSMHKMLPSFTQTALLHCNVEGKLLEDIAGYLKIFQTSSPSYLLMAGMDACVRYLEENRKEAFARYEKKLELFKEQLSKTCGHGKIRLLKHEKNQTDHIFELEPSKLVFLTNQTELTGREFYDRLRLEYGLQLEMASGHYAIAMTSIMDTQEGFDRLRIAVEQINETIKSSEGFVSVFPMRKEEKRLELCEAKTKEWEEILLKDAADQISGEFIYAYPPGIPFIVPGEVVSEVILDDIMNMKQQGISIQGMQDENAEKLRICKKTRRKNG